VRPTGQERAFGQDEIIVTKTDLQGRITYANDVFCRVSAMDEADVMGRPHNLIRHPDMPGGIFRLLWQRLQTGQELFAYAVNLAADGSHYWVFAHVTPTYDDSGAVIGYHSNRRSPSRSAVAAVEPLYRELLRAEDAVAGSVQAAETGYRVLEERLGDLGQSYDRFVWELTSGRTA
jgi:PAS domain S-box-containing protein